MCARRHSVIEDSVLPPTDEFAQKKEIRKPELIYRYGLGENYEQSTHAGNMKERWRSWIPERVRTRARKQNELGTSWLQNNATGPQIGSNLGALGRQSLPSTVPPERGTAEKLPWPPKSSRGSPKRRFKGSFSTWKCKKNHVSGT